MTPPEHTAAAGARRDQVYQWLHLVNEFALAGWFLTGSLLLLSPGHVHTGAWLFIAGSAQMLIGTVLRVMHKVQVARARPPAARS